MPDVRRAIRVLTVLLVAICAAVVGTGPPASAGIRFKVLHQFCHSVPACYNGTRPQELASDSAGNLYGVAGGGARGGGIVFQIKRESGESKFRILYNFCDTECPYGSGPQGRVVIDTAGNVYGVTAFGGLGPGGTLFELRHNAAGKWVYSVLYNFCTEPRGNCFAGVFPNYLTFMGQETGALYDGTSPLYGLTGGGGHHSFGVAYSLIQTSGKWREKVLYEFCAQPACFDGRRPNFLMPDGAGNLLGTTESGGDKTFDSDGGGVVFKLSPGKAWTETVLHRFCATTNCPDGAQPLGLVQDAGGNLFGTAEDGGGTAYCQGCGTLYSISRRGAFAVRYRFCNNSKCPDGAFPNGQLVFDAAGNLYGTTTLGARANAGSVFQWTPEQLETVRRFCYSAGCPGGKSPTGGMLLEPSGKLIGATVQGGRYNNGGTVFELTP